MKRILAMVLVVAMALTMAACGGKAEKIDDFSSLEVSKFHGFINGDGDFLVMYEAAIDDAVMGEEIFGPIMPILTYESFDAAIDELKSKEKPLALSQEGERCRGTTSVYLKLGLTSVNTTGYNAPKRLKLKESNLQKRNSFYGLIALHQTATL